jgi:hypothetical protein
MLTDGAGRTLEMLWVDAGGTEAAATEFASVVRSITEPNRFRHGAHAVEQLLDGAVTIRRIGSKPLDAAATISNLVDAELSPKKAASRLVLGTVAVGGAPGGRRPAWQHMTDTVTIAKNERLPPTHPVLGIKSPGGARSAYNSCTGDHGAPLKVATANRGPVG